MPLCGNVDGRCVSAFLVSKAPPTCVIRPGALCQKPQPVGRGVGTFFMKKLARRDYETPLGMEDMKEVANWGD